MSAKVWQFVRFCITGLLNSGVSFIVYYSLVHGGMSLGLSYTIGYAAGMVTSLLLNANWTFAVGSMAWTIPLKFIVTNLLVLALGQGVLHWLVGKVKVPAAFAQLITLLPTTIVNFVISKYWVFRGGTCKAQTKERENFQAGKL